MSTRAHLQSISPSATPGEVAAILAALETIAVQQRAEARQHVAAQSATLDEWVISARLRARRAGRTRGPWRLAGRVGRRNRA